MAARTRNRRFKADPEAIYVAWQGASGDIDGAQYVVQRGTRLKGSHPFVRHMGSAAFVEDGTPENEWPHVIDGAVDQGEARGLEEAKERAKAAAKAPSIPPNTRVSELMQCTQTISMSKAGSCSEGTVLLRSDPRVRLVPEAFRPLLERVVVG